MDSLGQLRSNQYWQPAEFVFTHAMICSVAVAINHANLGSWFKRRAKVPE
jgi:hypothetical protein